jgi:glycosyltransferase involved in cell wall biosynthesis
MMAPRVCLFTETFYPVVGGGETQAKALAQGLAANGFDVIILTRRSDASFRKIEQIGTVTVYRLPPLGNQHLKKWGFMLSSLPSLMRMCRQYDLIFVSGFRVLGISAMIISILLKKPCILKADSLGEMSGDFFASGLAKFGLRPSSLGVRLFLRARNSLLRHADCFVAISPAVAAELVGQGVNPYKIREIPNGVDLSRFRSVDVQQKRLLRQALHLPENGTIIMYTGRLVSYKGLPLLLEVWHRIKSHHEQVHLVLVGTGGLDIHNCEVELEEYAHRHGLQDSVHFTGPVENVHEYLQAADIFVFPTEREAFGISLIEAMACGLAVISTSVGGTKGLATHGQDGLLVEAGNFQQLYDALDSLITDRALSMRLGQNAWQTARQRFAAERVAAEYVDLFQCTTSASTCQEYHR